MEYIKCANVYIIAAADVIELLRLRNKIKNLFCLAIFFLVGDQLLFILHSLGQSGLIKGSSLLSLASMATMVGN